MTNEIKTQKLKQALGLLRKKTLEETVNMEDFEDILDGVIDDFKFERHTIDGEILDDKGILLAMYAFKEMSAFNGKEIYHTTYDIYYCMDSRGRIFRIVGGKKGYHMRFGRDNVEKISEDQFLNEIKEPYVNKRRGIIKRDQYLVDNLGDGYFLMVDDNLVDSYSLGDSEDLRFKTAYRNILKILKKREPILRELEEDDHFLYDIKTNVKVVAKPLGKPKKISGSRNNADIDKLTDERLRRARPSHANAYQVLERNTYGGFDGWYIDWIVQYYAVKSFGKRK